MRAKLGGAVFIAVFAAVAVLLLRMEFAQANLKTGIKLFEQRNTAARKVLADGVSRDPWDYLLRYHLAKSYQREAFAHTLGTPRAEEAVLHAMLHVDRALYLRSDSFSYTLKGDLFHARGMVEAALGYLNVGFFLSQDVTRLDRWAPLRDHQAVAAEWFWKNGQPGVALATAFNSLTGFAPFRRPEGAEEILARWFKEVPPERWFLRYGTEELEERKGELKKLFDPLSEKDRTEALLRMERAGFLFLHRYLKGEHE